MKFAVHRPLWVKEQKTEIKTAELKKEDKGRTHWLWSVVQRLLVNSAVACTTKTVSRKRPKTCSNFVIHAASSAGCNDASAVLGQLSVRGS